LGSDHARASNLGIPLTRAHRPSKDFGIGLVETAVNYSDMVLQGFTNGCESDEPLKSRIDSDMSGTGDEVPT
jgi:hypothetical protein